MHSKSHGLNTRKSEPITEGYTAPLIQLLSLLFLTISVLCVAAQFATKLVLRKRWGAADLILCLALFLFIGQLSTLLSPEGRVVGNSPTTLPNDKVDKAMKALYAGSILSVLTLGATKISLLYSLRAISPVRGHRTLIHATGIFTVVWLITAIFSIAFQCPSPRMWDIVDEKCTDIKSSRTYIAAANVFTDLALLIIPTIIILSVQLSWGKRLTLLGGFWFRLSVIGATIAQIVYLRRLVLDEAFLSTVWRSVLCEEVVLTTSIVSTTIPFLKPFLMSLESGFLRADDEFRRGETKGSSRSNSLGWTLKYLKNRNQQSWTQLVELENRARTQTPATT